MSIAVAELDAAFAADGFETRFKAEDSITSYVVTVGGFELEILDAVSEDGSVFEPSAFFEALMYTPEGFRTVTASLEGCESVPELVGAVTAQFN